MESKRNLVFAIGGAALLVVVLGLSVHSCNAHRAASAISDARTAIANVETEYADVRSRAAQAATTHARYLGPLGFEINSARVLLDDAKQSLSRAETASGSGEKIDRANVAEKTAKDAGKRVRERLAVLDELDSARSGYKSAIARLYDALDSFDARYRELRSQGYREGHFVHAVTMVATVRASLPKDFGISSVSVPVITWTPDQIDYLKIWRTVPQLSDRVQNTRGEIEAVPLQVAQNSRDADRLLVSIGRVQGLAVQAQMAAVVLESYPNYHVMAQVTAGQVTLASLQSQITEARRRNGMDVQDFAGAHGLLADTTARVTSIDGTFTLAITRRTELQAALDHFDEKDSAVSRVIANARDEIDSNSQNSQSSAKQYLAQAQNVRRDAKSLKASDPIAALAKLDDARTRANQAYNEVDTSTRSSPSVSFGSGSSGGGTSYRSSGSGTSSSPVYRSSPSGGGFHSSPSGGGFHSSPSGGGFHSSPSGGGFHSGH